MIAHHISNAENSRHKRYVKASHWIITVSFLTLVFSGFVILMCHPRLYWGKIGNDLTPALFELPISRNNQHGSWHGMGLECGHLSGWSANYSFTTIRAA